MKKMTMAMIAGCICLLSAVFAFAENQGCVTSDDAVKAWSDAVSGMDRPITGIVTTYAVCNPCSCPTNGMAACYEYMAAQERSKQEHYQRAVNLLDRAKKHGICKMDGGFVAGVRYGLLAYLQDPSQDDIPTITREAEGLYELIVVKHGNLESR